MAKHVAQAKGGPRWTGSISTGYVIEDLALTNARAWDINSSGEIVGSFVGRRGERGFYQTAMGVTKEFPILGYAGIAYAINENAQIVGISWFRSRYSHAVLWTGVDDHTHSKQDPASLDPGVPLIPLIAPVPAIGLGHEHDLR